MTQRLTLALALTLATGCAQAQPTSMNDLEIAHTAYVAGEIDIRYAHLALAISEVEPVRTFADLMLRDHKAVNDAALALVAELGVTPQDNPMSRQLLEDARTRRAELAGLSGAAFDCAYATNELAYHEAVNMVVETQFLPAVTVKPLADLLSEALATFKIHDGHAGTMVEALGC